jgi:hypothetical protein
MAGLVCKFCDAHLHDGGEVFHELGCELLDDRIGAALQAHGVWTDVEGEPGGHGAKAVAQCLEIVEVLHVLNRFKLFFQYFELVVDLNQGADFAILECVLKQVYVADFVGAGVEGEGFGSFDLVAHGFQVFNHLLELLCLGECFCGHGVRVFRILL